MAQPLPTAPPLRVRHFAIGISAYESCLKIEESLQKALNIGKNVGNDLIYIQILGYLLHYVVSDRALSTVVNEIVSTTDDSARVQLGKVYFEHYIRAFRATKGPTPMPSNHYSSRPPFDTIADIIHDTLNDVSQDHEKAKRLALIRDGFRCVVTGRYDLEMIEEIQELQKLATSGAGLKTATTQLAHIFDESTNQDMEPGSRKRDYASSMWTVMRRLGYENLAESLFGNKVHRLENTMTLSVEFQIEFDRLKVWFVATEEKNKYRLEGANAYWLCEYPKYVTFTTPDQDKYPVPDPIYLAIHAACAKIAHLSGAAAWMDKFESDMEDAETLDPDGASADMLEQAISALQARGHDVV